MNPRVVNVLLGLWLFVSAFLWRHSAAEMTNTWISGALVVVFSFIAFSVRWFRYVNTALAIWIFIAAFALPSYTQGTIWNNALVAIAIFLFSLAPPVSRAPVSQTRPPQPIAH